MGKVTCHLYMSACMQTSRNFQDLGLLSPGKCLNKISGFPGSVLKPKISTTEVSTLYLALKVKHFFICPVYCFYGIITPQHLTKKATWKILNVRPGAHHPEPTSPIWINLCEYLFLFLECCRALGFLCLHKNIWWSQSLSSLWKKCISTGWKSVQDYLLVEEKNSNQVNFLNKSNLSAGAASCTPEVTNFRSEKFQTEISQRKI